jgi:hypothetical protein
VTDSRYCPVTTILTRMQLQRRKSVSIARSLVLAPTRLQVVAQAVAVDTDNKPIKSPHPALLPPRVRLSLSSKPTLLALSVQVVLLDEASAGLPLITLL